MGCSKPENPLGKRLDELGPCCELRGCCQIAYLPLRLMIETHGGAPRAAWRAGAAARPQFATKAELATEIGRLHTELADKPGKVFLTTAIGVLLVAYAAGLAGLAALPVIGAWALPLELWFPRLLAELLA
jgi:hypothetical protein